MKLRAITLKDVRRFADPVRIDGIADGVNVFSAPNEFGKSTVFDALRALFFVDHGSRGKEIMALRPHAGGAPEVSVEVEIPDGTFRLSKRWLSKPEARVTKAGALVAQADAAETWIKRLVGGDDGGPSGLLWVRQGVFSLSEGSPKEQKGALEARRDLLSSVTGEVEAMTGGRRMDAALARCRAELAQYATEKGRPKANHAWAEASADVEALEVERGALADRVETLQTALADRTRMRRDLAQIAAPEAIADRRARLVAAAASHAAAQAHAQQVAAARQRLEAETRAVDRVQRDLVAWQAATRDHAAAVRRDAEAQVHLAATRAARDAADEAHKAAVVAHDADAAAQRDAEDLLRRVEACAAAAAAQDRRAELIDRIARSRVARLAVETATAEASVGPDEAAMDRLRALAAALTTARALRDSTATRVTMRYASGREGTVRHGAAPLEQDGIFPVHADTVLHLDGLGTLRIQPGAGPSELGDVVRAEGELARMLGALGMETLEAAGQAHRRRRAAEDTLMVARADLAALAPKGIEALQRQLAALPEGAADAGDLPTPEEAEAALRAARGNAAARAAVRDAARERRDTARTDFATAAARAEAAVERLEAARGALAPLGAQDEATLGALVHSATTARAAADADLARLCAAAPDVRATEAALARAQSVEDAARKDIDALRPAIAALTERITGNSGEAVEERLQETEEKLEVARAHLARVVREVGVLQRLHAALEAARADARDRYFEPVAGELRPLLHVLWPDAVLNWADDTLLPQSLTRNGQEEALDILSGGTQEQIAFLVRLAFARLLAKGGRHAPVILDDALVFTDDDRIERMFDALHRQARDLQIIVLSCRQRAFRNLGGTVLEVAAVGNAG